MYRISAETRQNLENTLGVSLEELGRMSADEQQDWVERRAGKKLQFSKDQKFVGSCSDPLLCRGRIRTMEDVDRMSKRKSWYRS